jgi:predicted transcriptional regulator
MALEGSLKDFGLADILQLIFFQRKTGVLSLEGKLDKVRIVFIEGNIAGAESRRRIEANRVGKILVKKGLIKDEDLQAILDEQRSSNVKLGNFLVRKGLVQKEEIEEILTGQVKETVIQIFGWKEGSYEFTPQAVPPDKDIPISIDTQHLLMEALRIVDEWTLIEGKITLDKVFMKKVEVPEDLTDEEKDILSLVDAENDVSTIIDISGRDDFSVSKTLVSLIEKGVLEQKEVLPVVVEAVPAETSRSVFIYRVLPLFVIALAVIVSLFPLFADTGQVFKKFRASEDIDNLRFRVEVYKLERGSLPETLDVISRTVDPWGNEYIYRQDGHSFIILSAGDDGEEGTSDDIY